MASEFAARARAAWARLIRKVYEADPLECPRCRELAAACQLAADPAYDPSGSRFSLGEAEASLNMRPVTRTLRALSHLLAARGLGVAGSRLD